MMSNVFKSILVMLAILLNGCQKKKIEDNYFVEATLFSKNKYTVYIQNKTDDHRTANVEFYIKQLNEDYEELIFICEDIELISKQALKVEGEAIKDYDDFYSGFLGSAYKWEYLKYVITDDRGKTFELVEYIPKD